MDFKGFREDLRFLLTRFKRPLVAWHDPNFGVRFDDYLDMIEDAVLPGSIDFVAESSLSLLTEPHLKRLKRNSFKGILPGIESWFALGDKSKTGALLGMAKVRQVSEHVNLILRHACGSDPKTSRKRLPGRPHINAGERQRNATKRGCLVCLHLRSAPRNH